VALVFNGDDNRMNIDKQKKIIWEILLTMQPVFDKHKGGAELLEIGNSYVLFGLLGHCKGCAMAPLTFGLMLDKLIKERLPHIKEVRYTDM
jgi:Fe-S cluster biogenesis protein NfuA